MNTKLKVLAAALALSCGAANAITVSTVQTSSGLFTTKANVCTITFDTVASLTACPGAVYTAPGGIGSHIVSGSVANQFAQPAGDATPYLTLGPLAGAPVVITLGAGANYFGFYAGSIDAFNSVMFMTSGGDKVTLSGTQINAFISNGAANGSSNGYFNIFTDALFTSITLDSTQNAFETDNHAFGIAAPVPEPTSISLLGLGALALIARQRRRSRKS